MNTPEMDFSQRGFGAFEMCRTQHALPSPLRMDGEMRMAALSLYDFTVDELALQLAAIGEPAWRAKQIYRWLYRQLVPTVADMTDLSLSLRARLAERFVMSTLQEVRRQVSAKDGTTKFLFELPDQATFETVIMPHDYGTSLCVSTQVGCRMGCGFCASTLGGLIRHLTTGEIVAQVVHAARHLQGLGRRVDSVVLMGSGEPLDNYEQTVRFIDVITAAQGLQIGQRHITVSTVGLVPAIRRLADERRGITLAVSLHAADDATRSAMMPVNRAYDIARLLEACHYYYQRTGRRVSFEYALIAHHNDRVEDAQRLAGLLGSLPCHVNLIPVNHVEERQLERSSPAQIRRFADTLERAGINATVRREMGSDISAACGQLRAQYNRERSG